MANDSDLRWKQRFASFEKARSRLTAAVNLARARPLSDLERQGLIQAFEFTHELAWNLMKDWLLWKGPVVLAGSRDVTREAFAQGLIADGETWMDMIRARNLSSHTYNEETAEEILILVVDRYCEAFEALSQVFKAKE